MLNDLLTLARIREGDIKAFEDVLGYGTPCRSGVWEPR